MELPVNQITKYALELEQKVIHDVLRQLLKREPNVSDFQKCNMVLSEDPLQYELQYLNITLGTIKRIIGETSLKIEFIPSEIV